MGVLIVMTNQMLIMFTIFIDYAYNADDQTDGAIQTYETMAAFFFLLFADYFLFVVLLGAFKGVIVSDGKLRFVALTKCFHDASLSVRFPRRWSCSWWTPPH